MDANGVPALTLWRPFALTMAGGKCRPQVLHAQWKAMFKGAMDARRAFRLFSSSGAGALALAPPSHRSPRALQGCCSRCATRMERHANVHWRSSRTSPIAGCAASRKRNPHGRGGGRSGGGGGR